MKGRVANVVGLVVLFTSVVYILLGQGVNIPYMPHAVYWRYDPNLIPVRILGDAATFIAYVLISTMLVKMLAYIEVTYPKLKTVSIWFACFVLFCGIGHLFEIVETYKTDWFGINSYYVTSIWKIVVGYVSMKAFFLLKQTAVQIGANDMTVENVHLQLERVINGFEKSALEAKALNKIAKMGEKRLSDTYERFGKEFDTGVSFDDIVVLANGEEHEIAKGVVITVDLIKGCLDINCKMEAGSLLPIHHHTDFSETFTLLKGRIGDDVSSFVFEVGKDRTFLPMEPHQIRAYEDSVMHIVGERL